VSFNYKNSGAKLDVMVYDVEGRLVTASCQVDANQLHIDLTGLSSGNYTLVVKSGDAMVKQQFQVVR
ncbi:MAG: T9SS type A sorting domain-containing protein, partial [FCB group bacterium]